ncbi:MAG: hypothetical protein OEY60_12255, partial [Nitrospira sp.]|nr:hypothetical protein [Nitrospira sp.]MDH5726233.1 hypothetical protein [Nitrospira sp.]
LFELLRRGPWVRVPAGSPPWTKDRTFKTTFILSPPVEPQPYRVNEATTGLVCETTRKSILP